MNREIKFRAYIKYKPTGEVVYGDCDILVLHKDSSEPERVVINGEKFKDDLSEIKLLQYTGLKDKNGKEIYEGDILKWEKSGLIEIKKVYWDCSSRWNVCNSVGVEKELDYEIIGNIYENKELLNHD